MQKTTSAVKTFPSALVPEPPGANAAGAGGDVDYDGVTGALNFTAAGEPGSGSYGIQTFTAENTIAEDTEFVIVGETG